MTERAIVEEERLARGEGEEKEQKKEMQNSRLQKLNKELSHKGLDMTTQHWNHSANKQSLAVRRQGPKHTFGWDVFNEDTLYEAYKKKCRSMPFNEVQYE